MNCSITIFPMKLLTFGLLFPILCFVAESVKHSEHVMEQFAKFRVHHGRKYNNRAEEEKRLGHFANNHKRIAELNAAAKKAGRNVSFSVNKFADKSKAEFHARLSKVYPSNHSDMTVYKPRHPRRNRTKRDLGDIPRNFDLREITVNGNQIIGPIKNQAECGCCWAFATTAITETVNALNSKKYTSLSDQEVCDCADSGNTPGCVGGDPRNGLQFVHRHGQASDEVYPYEEFRANTTGNCNYQRKGYVIQPESMQVYRFDADYAEEDIIENLYYNHIPTAVCECIVSDPHIELKLFKTSVLERNSNGINQESFRNKTVTN